MDIEALVFTYVLIARKHDFMIKETGWNLGTAKTDDLVATASSGGRQRAPHPTMLYGTAWKKDATAAHVAAALQNGFRGTLHANPYKKSARIACIIIFTYLSSFMVIPSVRHRQPATSLQRAGGRRGSGEVGT